jgi:hypothetical protein
MDGCESQDLTLAAQEASVLTGPCQTPPQPLPGKTVENIINQLIRQLSLQPHPLPQLGDQPHLD